MPGESVGGDKRTTRQVRPQPVKEWPKCSKIGQTDNEKKKKNERKCDQLRMDSVRSSLPYYGNEREKKKPLSPVRPNAPTRVIGRAGCWAARKHRSTAARESRQRGALIRIWFRLSTRGMVGINRMVSDGISRTGITVVLFGTVWYCLVHRLQCSLWSSIE